MFACFWAGLSERSPAFGAPVLTLSLTLTSVKVLSAFTVRGSWKAYSRHARRHGDQANGVAMEDPKLKIRQSVTCLPRQ